MSNKARAYPSEAFFIYTWQGIPEWGTWKELPFRIGFCLTIMERLGSNKHSSLLRKFEWYNYEKFYNIGTLAQYYETFYIRKFTSFRTNLEYCSLARLSSLV